jgi:hypothetical protein
MKTLYLESSELGLDFHQCMRLATSIAEHLLGEAILLSWYDRDRNYESPAHVSECHQSCEVPGYVDFASNRGGELVIDFGHGRYVFCYRPAGEFAENWD